jgi:hypothetical protein
MTSHALSLDFQRICAIFLITLVNLLLQVTSCAGPLGEWWRGLDSNQRTLARADLQSAAFNHSATSPRGHAGFACGQARHVAACLKAVNAQKSIVAPLGLSPRVGSKNSIAPCAIKSWSG